MLYIKLTKKDYTHFERFIINKLLKPISVDPKNFHPSCLSVNYKTYDMLGVALSKEFAKKRGYKINSVATRSAVSMYLLNIGPNIKEDVPTGYVAFDMFPLLQSKEGR